MEQWIIALHTFRTVLQIKPFPDLPTKIATFKTPSETLPQELTKAHNYTVHFYFSAANFRFKHGNRILQVCGGENVLC